MRPSLHSRVRVAALAAYLLLPLIAHSETRLSLGVGASSTNSLGIQASGISANDSVDFDNDGAFQITAEMFKGHNYDDAKLYYQVYLGHHRLNSETNSRRLKNKIEGTHLHIGGTYEIQYGKYMLPFVSGGLGGSYYSSKDDSDLYYSGSLGAGSRFKLTKRTEVYVEFRAIGVAVEDGLKVVCDEGNRDCALGFEGDFWWQRHVNIGASWVF